MKNPDAGKQVRVRYEQTTAMYANQFVLNASEDEVIVNFSSGGLPDPATGETHLPIHTRIAMSRRAAQNLVGLLNQALSSMQPVDASANLGMAAKLPPLNG